MVSEKASVRHHGQCGAAGEKKVKIRRTQANCPMNVGRRVLTGHFVFLRTSGLMSGDDDGSNERAEFCSVGLAPSGANPSELLFERKAQAGKRNICWRARKNLHDSSPRTIERHILAPPSYQTSTMKRISSRLVALLSQLLFLVLTACVNTSFLVVSSFQSTPPEQLYRRRRPAGTRGVQQQRPHSPISESSAQLGWGHQTLPLAARQNLRLTPAPSRSSSSSSSCLFLASSDDGGETLVPWRLENDFDTFLTQRSLQSFLFLLQSLRDAHSARWLDDFAQPSIPDDHDDDSLRSSVHSASTGTSPHSTAPPQRSVADCKLLRYHGLGALNSTVFPVWESFFGQLLDQIPITYTIVSDVPYVPDYDLEIVPASLCARLLSVREHLAREFAHDLRVIATAFGPNAYTSKGHQSRGGSEGRWGTSSNRQQSPPRDEHRPDTEARQASHDDGSLLFLDLPASDGGNGVEPSPLRKGNFDLLLLLCTQEGIHRALQDPTLDAAARDCLQNFYTERLFTHFVGNQPYGRADDFVTELLNDGPRRVLRGPIPPDGFGGSFGVGDPDLALLLQTKLVDSRRLAGLVLAQRQAVALEWQTRSLEVPAHHLTIKRMQLNLLMGRPANQTRPAAWG